MSIRTVAFFFTCLCTTYALRNWNLINEIDKFTVSSVIYTQLARTDTMRKVRIFGVGLESTLNGLLTRGNGIMTINGSVFKCFFITSSKHTSNKYKVKSQTRLYIIIKF